MDIEQGKQPSEKKSLINILVKIVLPLLLGVVILYFLFRDTDISQMWAIIKNANWLILIFSLLFGLLGNTFRAFRWGLMIRPLGYKPKMANLIYAIYGNYAINYAIPRGGEVWRCGIIAKEEKIPFKKLFGTLILDRALDSLFIIFVTLVVFFVNMQPFITYIKDNKEALQTLLDLLLSPYVYITLIAFFVFIFVAFKYFRDNFFVRKARNFVIGFWSDLKTIWRMKQKVLLVFHSLMIWLCYFLFFYITFYAFDFTAHLGIMAGLVAFALSTISLVIPTNGGMGPWHVAVITTLLLYGVLKDEADAFAFAVFTLQSLWTILCGLFGMFALSVKTRNNY